MVERGGGARGLLDDGGGLGEEGRGALAVEQVITGILINVGDSRS